MDISDLVIEKPISDCIYAQKALESFLVKERNDGRSLLISLHNLHKVIDRKRALDSLYIGSHHINDLRPDVPLVWRGFYSGDAELGLDVIRDMPASYCSVVIDPVD